MGGPWKVYQRQWTPEEEERLWTQWKLGLSVTELARAVGRDVRTVQRKVEFYGGIPPRPRRRDPRHLTLRDRETISRGLCGGSTIQCIAEQLGRPTSTISREVQRNGGARFYRAADAEERAWREGHRFKPRKLEMNPRLHDTVMAKLRLQWSPQQIAGWLKRKYRGNTCMQVSHETIYRSLFMQARGALKRELAAHLRRARFVRRARLANDNGCHGPIVDGISIAERPAEVEDRAVPGHWEGDLLLGDRGSAIATMVERASRFTMLVRVDGLDSKSVTKALARHIQRLPEELRRSLTWDRGAEMARHEEFTVATDVQVYFCDPHSPWQRGSNENTNGLLRQYFPKGEPVDGYTQTQLNAVAHRLNGRPRKTLDFKTPAESLAEFVAMSS